MTTKASGVVFLDGLKPCSQGYDCGVVVAIALCEHLHKIPYNLLVAMKIKVAIASLERAFKVQSHLPFTQLL